MAMLAHELSVSVVVLRPKILTIRKQCQRHTCGVNFGCNRPMSEAQCKGDYGHWTSARSSSGLAASYQRGCEAPGVWHCRSEWCNSSICLGRALGRTCGGAGLGQFLPTCCFQNGWADLKLSQFREILETALAGGASLRRNANGRRRCCQRCQGCFSSNHSQRFSAGIDSWRAFQWCTLDACSIVFRIIRLPDRTHFVLQDCNSLGH